MKYLTFTWSENCFLTNIITRAAVAAHGDNPVRSAVNAPTNAPFKITGPKLYVPEDDNKLLEQLKSAFKRSIKWNQYKVEMTTQTKTNKSNYLIDSTFNKVNRLFVLSFENEEDVRWIFFKVLCTKS